MKKLLLGLSCLCLPSLLFAGGTILKSKNELTEQTLYTYTNFSTSHSKWALKIECHPEGHVLLSITSTTYGWGIDSKYHARFNFKLDNLPVEKYKIGYGFDGNEAVKARDGKLARRLLIHDKLIVDAYDGVAGLPTPIFDIKDFRHKSKAFSGQCNLQPTEQIKPKPNTPKKPGSTPNSNTHKHGDRSHSHPLPDTGIAHKHGGGEVGTK